MGSQKRTVLCHWGWIVTKSLNKKELMYIGIGWLHDLNAIVFYNESPTNNISCLVC
jgi:hypothetical protein